jgi:hypothetical protein
LGLAAAVVRLPIWPYIVAHPAAPSKCCRKPESRRATSRLAYAAETICGLASCYTQSGKAETPSLASGHLLAILSQQAVPLESIQRSRVAMVGRLSTTTPVPALYRQNRDFEAI